MSRSTRRGNKEGSVFQKSNGKWTAQIQVGVTPEGKRKFRTMTGDTKKEAELLLNELKRKYSGLSTAEMLEAPVSEAAEIWFNDKMTGDFSGTPVKGTSLDRIEQIMHSYILPSIGNIELGKVNDNTIRTLLNNMKKPDGSMYSISTGKKVYNYLNNFFNFCVERRWINSSPMVGVKLCKTKFSELKDIDSFTKEECEKLIKFSTEKHENGSPVYECGYAIPIMLETGCRCGELLSLKWENVNFEKRQIHIVENITVQKDRSDGGKRKLTSGTPKSKSSRRIIPLTDKAYTYFKLQKEYRYYGEEFYVFNVKDNTTPRPFGDSNLRRAFANIQKKAGIEKKGLHSLRHTFATNMLYVAKENLVTVSRLLGHTDVSTTLRYVSTTVDEYFDAIRNLEKSTR